MKFFLAERVEIHPAIILYVFAVSFCAWAELKAESKTLTDHPYK